MRVLVSRCRDHAAALVTAVAAAIGLASSVVHLGRRPLWIDEALSLGATHQLGRTLRDTAGTMGSYYVLLDGWTALFGTSRTALRSLSVVLAVAALVVVAAVARRLLGPAEAAATALLAAGLPGLTRVAQDARAYALLLLVTAAIWLLVARAVTTGDRSWRPWLLVVPLVLVGELGQGLFLLQLAGLGAAVLLHPDRWTWVRRLAPAAVAGLAALLGLLALGADDVGDWIPDLSAEQLPPLLRHFVGGVAWAAWTVGAVAVVGLSVLAHRAVRGGAEERWPARALLAWALVPPAALVALSAVRPSLLGRYVLASQAAVAALVAVGAVALARALGRVRVPAAAAGVAVAAVLAASLLATRAARDDGPYERWDRVAAHLAREVRPGDGLVFSHAEGQAVEDTARAPFEAAWGELDPDVVPVALSPARPLGEVRRFDDLTPQPELARRMVRHARVWVVGFRSFWRSERALRTVPPADGAFRRERVVDEGGIRIVLLVRA